MLARTVATGQGHTRDWSCPSEYGAELYNLVAYKEKAHESTYFLSTCNQAHILCNMRATKLLYRSKRTRFVILHEHQPPAFQDISCPWASGAYRLEALLIYRSLKHSNLNLKYSARHHTEAQQETEEVCLKAYSQLVSLYSLGPHAQKICCPQWPESSSVS